MIFVITFFFFLKENINHSFMSKSSTLHKKGGWSTHSIQSGLRTIPLAISWATWFADCLMKEKNTLENFFAISFISWIISLKAETLVVDCKLLITCKASVSTWINIQWMTFKQWYSMLGNVILTKFGNKILFTHWVV